MFPESVETASASKSVARWLRSVERLGAVLLIPFLGGSVLAAPQFPAPGANEQAILEARGLMDKKKWSEAVVVLRKLLKEAPDAQESTKVAVALAKALTYASRREEALSVLGQAVSRDRSNREALIQRIQVLSRTFLSHQTFQIYQEGMNFLLAKKYGNARGRFRRALEVEPDHVEILVRLGQCLVMDSDYDSAAERLRLARKLNPHEPEVHLWLGRALHQRGELKEAIMELREAYRRLPQSELAPLWLAEVMMASGQKAAALQILEEDVKKEPFHLRGLVALARHKYLSSSKDSQALWAARKDLQVALSRLDQYGGENGRRFESSLGLDLRDVEQVRSESQSLLQRLDSRLEGQGS